MVPRGRVELPTPAFSGPRSTDELPRHRNNPRFYGKAAAGERENRPSVCFNAANSQRKSHRSRKRRLNYQSARDRCETIALQRRRLLHRLIKLAHPVLLLQHLARLRTIRRPHDAVLLHQVDQSRRTAIAHPQPPLQC